jgi:hypothetical protein
MDDLEKMFPQFNDYSILNDLRKNIKIPLHSIYLNHTENYFLFQKGLYREHRL